MANKFTSKKVFSKALRALFKAAVIYGLYYVFILLFNQFGNSILNFQFVLEFYVLVYIVFVVLIELFAETIVQHILVAAYSLFSILYVVLALDGGLLHARYENVQFMVDIRFFLFVFVLLGLLGLAKSLIQTIKFCADKEEKLFQKVDRF